MHKFRCLMLFFSVCAVFPPVLPFSLWGASPELAQSIFRLHGSSLTNDPVWIQASASFYLQIHLQPFDLITPPPPTHTLLLLTLYSLKLTLSLLRFSLSSPLSVRSLTPDVDVEGWYWDVSTETAHSFYSYVKNHRKRVGGNEKHCQFEDQNEHCGDWCQWSTTSCKLWGTGISGLGKVEPLQKLEE